MNLLKNDGTYNLRMEAAQVSSDDDRRYCPTAMFVRFTSYHESVACGELQTQYMDKVFSFAGLDQLLLIMDDVMEFVRASCEKITFPQAAFERRNFNGNKSDQTFHEMDETEHISEFCVQPAQTMTGSMAFAIITVYYRQHASMQGELHIAKQKVFFRSGLELMRLLHQALAASQKKSI